MYASQVRRLDVLSRILSNRKSSIQPNLVRATSSHGKVTIDDISKPLKAPENPELVPIKYYHVDTDGKANLTQTTLHHLRWMLQKDILGQDMFLLGRPGPLRRTIALQYLQLTQREIEYVALSRDTTESDLKQRREILNGTATYFDQSVVRAAKKGRILVIEGVEKAERNVLPVLNNLLENREMHLEDGHFLIPADRYDKLMKEHTQEELNRWGLVRVSEDFRVIALGLPVPKYRGAPLDPPLRSRFQARDVTSLSYQEILNDLKASAPNVNSESLVKLVSFCTALSKADATTVSYPEFPIDSLKMAAKVLNNNPHLPIGEVIQWLYPYKLFLPRENWPALESLFESFDIAVSGKGVEQQIVAVEPAADGTHAQVSLKVGNKNVAFDVPGGVGQPLLKNESRFIETKYQNNVLADIMQSYAAGDFCLIGPRGSGKSALVVELCKRLGQTFEPMVLYQDMTTRDLIQQRTTKLNGDTVWRDSPLVTAARNGHIAVLDSVHRIHHSTVSILHRLVHDRELQLYDGKRLMRHDKYDELLASGMTKEQLESQGLFRIHPSFRIIALGEPPTLDSGACWLTPEMLSLFIFHEIRNLSKNEEIAIIRAMYGEKISPSLMKIINLGHFLRESKDSILRNLSGTLSTRQLLRLAHRYSIYSKENDQDSYNSAYETVQEVFLAKFLPSLPRASLENAIRACEIAPLDSNRIDNSAVKITKDDKYVTIGRTKAELYKTEAVTKIPDILFYDVPQHVRLMENLLQDFLLGSHLLLIGNQGVGKNKIADRLLQLLNRPREYIQLHRDTTVQTLTLQPNIVDGVVVYEDSPLVKAVKMGHILVVDEADKAPTHVTCILKTLVENGEMTLSDGRKIVPKSSNDSPATNNPLIIQTHPDFRMFVLANRPGFPFLGNDFFGVLGDLFSCHAVDNPSMSSETALLSQYGPDVPKATIKQLVRAFSELRTMADVGQLSYPYSTREAVNIVKHLQRFPEEDMSELVGNVLDFDRYSPESLELVTGVMQKHGLQIGAYATNELAAIRRKKEIQMTVQSTSGKSVSNPKHGKVDPNNDPHVGGNTWAGGTGGRDTAGLGGKGGPYRLDAGHKVHQLSDAEKDDIPEHVKAAAREMNRKAFEAKLKEIQMSKYDHTIYEQFSNPVRPQVQALRVILNSLQAKSKERHWTKHQTSGELDDAKLIEGITGERGIYRRRVEQDPEPGQPQEKPKRLKLVVDVSGSMYRFNGYDGRLDRELEAVVMVMESFEGFEQKVQYDIVGHSGEAHYVPFVDAKSPPKDDKERLNTIRMMHAHSQYCWSGDHTLPATDHAVTELAKEDCDEAIVIVLSDANLSRYSISPKKFSDTLVKKEPKVQGYVIFIGSLGEEAEMIRQSMQAGRAFTCMDLAELPQILKQIFASSVLRQVSTN